MVKKDLFALHWELWCERWPKTALKAVAAKRLFYEIVADEMDDAAFEAGSKAIFRDNEFFPTPKQVIEAVSGGEAAANDRAREEFVLVLDSRSWRGDGRRSYLRQEVWERLSPSGQQAVRALGQERLAGADPETSERDFLLKSWLSAYRDRGQVDDARRIGGGGGAVALADVVDSARRMIEAPGRVDSK